mgnify:CR=1 FL=1
MTILKKDRINRFRDRLYQKKMPRLLLSGSDSLRPISRSKVNEEGNTIIETREIIQFFQNSVSSDSFIDSDQYFANLYLVFRQLSRDSDQYTFEPGVQTSVEDINRATNKKAIEYLTGNLIISFFENAHLSDGSDTDDFLKKDLKTVIKKTNEGRDYRTLVSNTLQAMVQTLKEDKPWRESLDDIQTAALVCRLVGARLPQIDKAVLSKNVRQAREEIEKDLAVFTKILNTRDQTIREEKNKKVFLKTMQKLDTALFGVFKRIDTFLGYAHTFIGAVGISRQGFLGSSDDRLKQSLARFFFNCRKKNEDNGQVYGPLTYSTTRYLMRILMDHPELVRFSLSLKEKEEYTDCFPRLFSLFFNEIIKQTAELPRAKKFQTGHLESCLGETLRLIDTFHLDPDQMKDEKLEIKKRFLSLIRSSELEHLPKILALKDKVSQVTQDEKKELLEDTRRVLIDNFNGRLLSIETGQESADEMQKTVRKMILNYSLHYRPRQFFYQRFFTRHIANAREETVSESFTALMGQKKILAMAILTFFSDFKQVGEFMSKKQVEFADKLLQRMYE